MKRIDTFVRRRWAIIIERVFSKFDTTAKYSAILLLNCFHIDMAQQRFTCHIFSKYSLI